MRLFSKFNYNFFDEKFKEDLLNQISHQFVKNLRKSNRFF